VLVTGGAGYIGSHACKALAAGGYLPIAYDNLVHGHRWAVQWGPLEIGDINDRSRVESVLAEYRPVAAMHFAAYANVGESVRSPLEYYWNNVVGTLNLLSVLRDNGVDKFVFSSSCATYGHPRSELISEDHPQLPVSPYGQSKLMIESVLRDLNVAYGLRSFSLRYFNAAGADRGAEIGELHEPETHLIPLALDAASGAGPRLTVYGANYETHDGTCVRDYVHVQDLADAHLIALRALDNGAAASMYNLGTGRGYSVLQVIEAVERVTGMRVAYRLGERRAGDPASLVADASRFATEYSWAPRHSDLDTIVRSAWQWRQKRLSAPKRH
jgi:UDP-arabinose 4-epimerase